MLAASVLFAQPAGSPVESELLTTEGQVEVYPVNGTQWAPAHTNQVLHIGDRLRTAEHSRATLRLSDLTLLRVNELTTLQIRPPQEAGRQSLLDVSGGSLYFLSREKPARQQFRTPLSSGAIRGTEFNLSVGQDGKTAVALIEGELTLSNELGQVAMASGEMGTVEAGKAPAKSPMVEAINIIQWCLYYPGVLDVEELPLSTDERQALGPSLAAYSSGDLLQAAAKYPSGRSPGSDAERVYRAATLLAVGQVDQAEALLDRTGTGNAAKLGLAVGEVIAAVKNQPGPRATPAELASEHLAESYYFQSHGQLQEALDAARAAVLKSPNFGFGWARVAELELSFGHQASAMEAIDKSIQLSPNNAQSYAVKGFILLAQNHIAEAEAAFDHAISLDGALGNAWLGRGLCKVRGGHREEGRQDMQTAAVLEPQRAILRSYLGKSFSNAGDNKRAEKELGLAQKLDPNDPTAWLYSALVEEEQNQVNSAVRDLEQSKKLNDNERLFRSKMLLDQDRAVRGANLANVYQDTGIINWNKGVAMSDWGVREASRAVSDDYANFSAHQFLANNYDALRDPQQFNLRYDTPWLSELLMANMLAPVGAGNLSEFSSQQAYARLFQENHFGASSDTEYLTHGDWIERASQYGVWGPASYAVDVEYRSLPGWRPNNQIEDFTGTVRAKDQLTPQDSILIEGIYYSAEFGDIAQYYNNSGTINNPNAPAPSTTFSGHSRQWGNFDQPNILLGYNHEWSPGSHTLVLGGRLNDRLFYSDPVSPVTFTFVSGGQVAAVLTRPLSVQFDRTIEAYSGEIQQIWQTEHNTLVAGARYLTGDASTFAQIDNPNSVPPTISSQRTEADLDHYSVYGYETIKPFDILQLTAGISYDFVRYPQNIDTAPISTLEVEHDQVSPKVGFVLTPLPDTHLRFAYTRSLGGSVFNYDNNLRLEPTEVAGFNQTFRSLIPESVVGVVPGTHFTTYSAGIEQSFKTSTYLTLEGRILDSTGERSLGVLTNSSPFPVPDSPGNISQSLDFTEQTVLVSLNQLICDNWSLGARYQVSHADLKSTFGGIPTAAPGNPSEDVNATLQQLTLYANYYHRCGFFSQFQGIWTGQHNAGYGPPGLPGDYFWQFNLYAGYRFLHRAAEVRVGLLNLTDQDYTLNPLNLYYDQPRGRTVSLAFKFYF